MVIKIFTTGQPENQITRRHFREQPDEHQRGERDKLPVFFEGFHEDDFLSNFMDFPRCNRCGGGEWNLFIADDRIDRVHREAPVRFIVEFDQIQRFQQKRKKRFG